MDAIKQSIGALRKQEQNRLAADGLQAQIRQLQADMVSETELGYVTADKIASSRRIKALVDQKRVLEAREKALRCHVKQVERVLASLPEQENEVLTTFFCKNLTPGVALRRLERQLNVEQSQVYNIRKRALRHFACRMGYTEEEE